MLTEQIKQKAAEYAEYLTEFRRDLHRHPELSMQERRTAQKIEEALKQIPGMEVQAGGAKKGRAKPCCCGRISTLCPFRKPQVCPSARRMRA